VIGFWGKWRNFSRKSSLQRFARLWQGYKCCKPK